MGPVSAPETRRLIPAAPCGPGRSAPGLDDGWPSASYLEKWSVLGVVIGAVAGLGAIVFYEALVVCTHFFLNVCAGYQVPTPAGEGGLAASTSAARPWALPADRRARCTARRDRWSFASLRRRRDTAPTPPSRRCTTTPRGVRFRAVDRQDRRVGPHHRLGWLGRAGRPDRADQRRLRVAARPRSSISNPADGRIAVATGIGSGIGAIFGAPLGGAVLASEILYRDDFDPAALLPSFIASVVSFVVFGAVEGLLTALRLRRDLPLHRPGPARCWFALIGVLGGLIGLLYAKGFYGLAGPLQAFPVCPGGSSPAIGGLIVGAIAIAIPEVIGTGYGWVPAVPRPTTGSSPSRCGSCSSSPSPASWPPACPSARADRGGSSVPAS